MWPAESKSEEKPQKRVDNGRRGLWWYSVKVVTYVVPLTRRAASPREKSKRVNAPQAPSALVLESARPPSSAALSSPDIEHEGLSLIGRPAVDEVRVLRA